MLGKRRRTGPIEIIPHAVQHHFYGPCIRRLHMVDCHGRRKRLRNLEGKHRIAGGDGHAVGPEQIRLERVCHLHAPGPVDAPDDLRAPVRDARNFRAQPTDHRAGSLEAGHVARSRGTDMGLDAGRRDIGVHVRRKLHHADRQRVMPGRVQPREHRACQGGGPDQTTGFWHRIVPPRTVRTQQQHKFRSSATEKMEYPAT